MKRAHLFALALALVGWLEASHTHAGRELLVIVHASNPATQLDKSAIKSHFLKQSPEWDDGNKVRPADQPGDAKVGFVAKVLGMTPKDYERFWLEQKYASAVSPPKRVDDDGDMLKYVGASKGAIGFIDAGSLGDNRKVKVVLKLTY